MKKVAELCGSEFTRLEDLNKEEWWALRNEIVLNSLYVADYNNSIGANPSQVCDVFDGYVEELFNKAEEDGFEKIEDFFAVADKYDNADNLFYYMEDKDFGFVTYDWEDEQIENDDTYDWAKLPKDLTELKETLKDRVDYLINDYDDEEEREWQKKRLEEIEELTSIDDFLRDSSLKQTFLRGKCFSELYDDFEYYKDTEDGTHIWLRAERY